MTIEEKVAQSILHDCFCVSYETGKHSRWHYCSEHGVEGWGGRTAREKENGQPRAKPHQNNKCGSEVGTVGGPRGWGGAEDIP